MKYPVTRLRRLRYNPAIRAMVNETTVSLSNLVMPLFVCTGLNVKNPISAMPGNFQMSIDVLVEECLELYELGVKSVLLFGILSSKDEDGTVATHHDSVIPMAIRAIKLAKKEMFIIADVCNCQYTRMGTVALL